MCVVVVLYFYKERKASLRLVEKKYKSRIEFDKKSECEDCFGLW